MSYSNVNEISYFQDIANCISKNAFWNAAWRWLYKEAETRRWFNYLLIISHVIKVVLDWNFVYLLLVTENNVGASPGNEKRIPPACHYIYYRGGHFAPSEFTPTDFLVHLAAKLSIPTSKY